MQESNQNQKLNSYPTENMNLKLALFCVLTLVIYGERTRKITRTACRTTSTKKNIITTNHKTLKYATEIFVTLGSEVEAWLKSLGLSNYFTVFKANGFDSMSICKEINEEDFQQLNITNPEHKQVLTNAISVIRGNQNSTKQKPDTKINLRLEAKPIIVNNRV